MSLYLKILFFRYSITVLGYTMPKNEIIHTWYVTISPNPRRIYEQHAFAAMNYQKQLMTLHKNLMKCYRWCTQPQMVYYELNKSLVAHCHFQVDATETQIQIFQTNINTSLGNTKNNPSICCHLCRSDWWKPKSHPTWLAYCQKDDWVKKELKCVCIKCKYLAEDKRLLRKLEYGLIELTF